MDCIKCGANIPDGGIYCSQCGARNDGKKECQFCGASINVDATFCTFCGKRVDGKKICPKCGAEIEGDFCAFCGTKYEVCETAKKSDRSCKPKSKFGEMVERLDNKLIPVILMISTLALLLCALFAGLKANISDISEELTFFNLFGSELDGLKELIEIGDQLPGEFVASSITMYVINAISLVVNVAVCLIMFVWAVVVSIKALLNGEAVKSIMPLKVGFSTYLITMSTLYFANATVKANVSLNGGVVAGFIIGGILIVAIGVLKQLEKFSFTKYDIPAVAVRVVMITLSILTLSFVCGESVKFVFDYGSSSMTQKMTTMESLITISSAEQLLPLFGKAMTIYVLGVVIVVLAGLLLCFNVYGLIENKKVSIKSLIVAVLLLIIAILYCIFAKSIINSEEMARAVGEGNSSLIGPVRVMIVSIVTVVVMLVNFVIQWVVDNNRTYE